MVRFLVKASRPGYKGLHSWHAALIGCAFLLNLAPEGIADDALLGQKVMAKRDARVVDENKHILIETLPWPATVTKVEANRLWIGPVCVPIGDVVRFDEALEYYTAEILSNPDALVYRYRGIVWYEKNELGKALNDFNDAIRLGPHDENSFNERGRTWYQKQKYDNALADYSEAIRLEPRFANAYYNRGIIWYEKQMYNKALDDFSAAIHVDSRNPWYYVKRANTYYAIKADDNAVNDLSEAIRLDPKNAGNLCTRGIVLGRAKRHVEAVTDFTTALVLDPKYVNCYRGRSLIYCEDKEFDKALNDIDTAILLDPNNGFSYGLRAKIYCGKKQYACALEDLAIAIRLDPKDSDALNSRAWLLAACPEEKYRDGKKAVEDATNACELSNWKDVAKIDTLAASCAESSDFAAAMKWEQRAIEIEGSGSNSSAYQNRMELYQHDKPYRDIGTE